MPVCGPGQVLVKVLASSVNPIDWKIVSGMLKAMMPKTFPTIIGFECCGVAVDVGADVEGIEKGDAVWSDPTTGCYAQYVAIDAKRVGRAPANFTPEQAAVVPLTGLTSLQALATLGLKEGSRVLILGGSSGTGGAAVQIAKSQGFHVTTTCSSRNVDFVKSLGADVVINYNEAKWWEEAKDIDGIYDCVGEQEVFAHAQAVLKDGGKFTTIAALGVDKFAFERGITGRFILTNSQTRDDLDTLKALCESGALTQKIHKSFPLADIWDAFKESKGGRVVGKIALSVEH
jgi:NADPH:quinone reductase-like Zn-dependent oxidoreductase